MTEEQIDALRRLIEALDHAADYEILDLLAEDTHPDVINNFCDAVAALYERRNDPPRDLVQYG